MCLASIGQFGDHRLKCSHGLMRICRHIDTLADIVCHALSQSHPGVLKEQCVSCKDHSRPGNVYHLDFQYGQSAYFNLSVCSTTQPCNISYSSSHCLKFLGLLPWYIPSIWNS